MEHSHPHNNIQNGAPPPSTPHKRGLGWPWNNTAAEFAMYAPSIKDHKITWLFNWEMWKPAGLPGPLSTPDSYIPQVRLGSQAHEIDESLSALHQPITHLIGFNEPDMASESNMPVPTAVQLWRQFVLPAKSKFHFKLGSPAMTSSPKGKQWLQDFFHQLPGSASGVDFVVVHWYGTDAKQLENFLNDMHNTFKKPLWLTEFAYTRFDANHRPTEGEVEAFIKEAVRFLDGCAFVERYAYFGAPTDVGPAVGEANNLSKNGQLTPVGKLYTTM